MTRSQVESERVFFSLKFHNPIFFLDIRCAKIKPYVRMKWEFTK
jgi:hypothetical protein